MCEEASDSLPSIVGALPTRATPFSYQTIQNAMGSFFYQVSFKCKPRASPLVLKQLPKLSLLPGPHAVTNILLSQFH